MDSSGGVSTGGNGGAQQRAVTRRRSDKPYKGIRMRKWGKWVAEIREPNKRSRIWLGSYSTAVAAARAYDTAVYYLRGPTAKLNFPEEIAKAGVGLMKDSDLSAASIRKMAAEVGARVDALHTGQVDNQLNLHLHANHHNQSSAMKPSWFHDGIDLNKKPEPEPESDDKSTVDYW